jgi:hypothetical protein
MKIERFRYLVRQALRIAGTLDDPQLVPSAFVRVIRAMIDEEHKLEQRKRIGALR